MDALGSPRTANSRRRSRKSIAHVPSSTLDQNNPNTRASVMSASPREISTKRNRSKSIGPGSLDVLREDSGNRLKSTTEFKSILKPTIPLSPPKTIPPHIRARKSSPSKPKDSSSPQKSRNKTSLNLRNEVNVDLPSQNGDSDDILTEGSSQSPSVSPNCSRRQIAVRTEEQQQAALAERERQDLLARKDARRKSLANRRVSFAPEATLHTWDVVELPEDSTTSSASTNSTRRGSTLTAPVTSPFPQPRSPISNYNVADPPSTPPQQGQQIQVEASPQHQRNLHQKKRRRSSAIPPMNFNNPEDFSSSPYSADSVNSDDADQAFPISEVDAESSESDDHDVVEDETITGVDREDATRRSHDTLNTESSGRLDEALRQAAQHAGTQGIDYDENGDITMELADEEVTAFKPWATRGTGLEVFGISNPLQDQENINPFSPAFKAKAQQTGEKMEDQTMDITTAVGSILPQDQKERRRSKAGSDVANRGAIKSPRRQSLSTDSDMGDETMEMTVAVGGIDQASNTATDDDGIGNAATSDEDEGISMDFTAVVGGVLGSKMQSGLKEPEIAHYLGLQQNHNISSSASRIGRSGTIVSATNTHVSAAEGAEEHDDDITLDMDITNAFGAILPRHADNSDRLRASKVVGQDTHIMGESEANMGAQASPPTRMDISNSQEGGPSMTTMTMLNKGNSHEPSRPLLSPRISARQPSPLSKPFTPTKQVTPQITRPTVTGKTPPSRNVAMRTGSPKKLFKREIQQTVSSPSGSQVKELSPVIATSEQVSTVDVGMRTRLRRTSGLGLDRIGLGSPRVAEILDRRSSITHSSSAFLPGGQSYKGVRFADPWVLERELESENLKAEERESGHGDSQLDANEQRWSMDGNATSNLKDRIQSLTPQRKRLNGRKSLHVGAAKGILGKRPAELDDEGEDNVTPTHLRNLDSSPVKKVKLPGPAPKGTTSGRITRSARAASSETYPIDRPSTPLTDLSPPIAGLGGTPRDQPPFREPKSGVSPLTANIALIEEHTAQTLNSVESSQKGDRIQLQDFLNLTSIRFMELTTTKRRHTVVPNEPNRMHVAEKNDGTAQDDTDKHLEDYVISGACVVPMLDLYQHSCRELKNYIAEGRNIVHEIEVETFEDNPSLFREYMSAPAEVRSIMDSQFKNIKTHARLLSKAMWYEWRMKLLDGLKEGLIVNAEDMQRDAEILTQQESLVHSVLPGLISEHDRLKINVQTMQIQADELAGCDQDVLQEARSSLVAIDKDIRAKRTMIWELQSQLSQSEIHLEYSAERKSECIAEIGEAERIRQESRGWDIGEIRALEDNVNGLKQDYGWTIASAVEETLTMTYRSSLQLYFTPGAFKRTDTQPVVAESQNASISLAYIADVHDYHPQPLSTEKRFFLQSMRAQLQFLQQSQVTVRDLLLFISSSWDIACRVAEEARLLGVQYMSEPMIVSDESLSVQSTVLLREMKTKVNVTFGVNISSGEGVADMDLMIVPSANVVYGENLNAKRMGEFLATKIKTANGGDKGQWARIVGDLEQQLIARGKKS